MRADVNSPHGIRDLLHGAEVCNKRKARKLKLSRIIIRDPCMFYRRRILDSYKISL